MKLQSQMTVQKTSPFDDSTAGSLPAQIIGGELNGRRMPFEIEKAASARHVHRHASLLKGKNTLRLCRHDDFEVAYSNLLPPLGSTSRGLRIKAGAELNDRKLRVTLPADELNSYARQDITIHFAHVGGRSLDAPNSQP